MRIMNDRLYSMECRISTIRLSDRHTLGVKLLVWYETKEGLSNNDLCEIKRGGDKSCLSVF